MTVRRIPCCVPFCRRTFKAETDDPEEEVICGKHWRLAPKDKRRLRATLRRRYTRNFGDNPYWIYPPGSPQRILAVRLGTLIHKLWIRCKAAAIERAGGL